MQLALPKIKENMILKHEKLIAAAAKKKVQILGLQELFYGPYFCAEQHQKWYELTESVPDGPTTTRMQKLAKKIWNGHGRASLRKGNDRPIFQYRRGV